MTEQQTIQLVSVILPVRNEIYNIRTCLERVLNQQNLPAPLEVIVADGMSVDGTREVIKEIQFGYSNLFLIDNPLRIAPTGINLAMRQAKGEIIIRVDGHCIIAPDYVGNCVKHLKEDGVDGVGGAMESIGETPIAETIALAMSSSFGVGNSAFRTTKGKTMLVDTIPFPAYSRDITQKAGLYDEELVRNQDDEYNYRIRELGGKLLLAEDVRSRYFSRSSLCKLWKQYYQYGFYKVRVLQKHPRQMSLRQFIPPLFVFSVIVSFILGLSSGWKWFPLVILTSSYLLANLVASLIISTKKGFKYFPRLPITFIILHFSYGLGFLAGMIKFWNRWGDKKGFVPTIPKPDISDN